MVFDINRLSQMIPDPKKSFFNESVFQFGFAAAMSGALLTVLFFSERSHEKTYEKLTATHAKTVKSILTRQKRERDEWREASKSNRLETTSSIKMLIDQIRLSK